MIVTHFACTPLAGSPLRIVRALQSHTKIDARLIVVNPVAYGRRTFETDLVWDPHDQSLRDRIARSDVLHFHHWMDFHSNPFHVDFDHYLRKGAAAVRQFHTHPLTIAQGSHALADAIIADTTPQLVIGQFHERFYPRARIVPNIVPINDQRYRPIAKQSEDVTVFYAPTASLSAWQSRWDTKAAPETQRLLKRLRRNLPGMRVEIARDIPHSTCLELRQQSDISIDELATGSYHLSSLEGLSQGVPTLAFLDQRMLSVLASMTGSHDVPWINVTLEQAYAAIRELVCDQPFRVAAGNYSRNWMERYWDDRLLVQHYVSAYHDLLHDPSAFRRQRFDPDCRVTRWFVQQRDDQAWAVRKQRAMEAGLRGWFYQSVVRLPSNVVGPLVQRITRFIRRLRSICGRAYPRAAVGDNT